MATNFADDFALLASLGLTTHQLTIDWARLEPEPGRFDDDAIEHQLEVLAAARDAGIDAWACLLDHALPGWFSEDGDGLLDDRNRGYFWARHVDRCGELFGDLVAGWVPVRSPFAFASGAFLGATLTGDRFPPGQSSTERFTLALRGAHLAGFDAWRLLSSGDRPVMCSMDLAVVEPMTSGREPREQVAAEATYRRIDDAMWTSWIRAIEDGVLMVPGRADEEVPHALGAYDLIGASYHGGRAAVATGTTTAYPKDALRDAAGDAAWSEGLGIVLRRLADSLPKRDLVVTACQVATRQDSGDDLRTEHLAGCLDEVVRARTDGVPVAGFLAGTAIDGYEWGHGFDIATGVIDRSRDIKPSGELLRGRSPFASSGGDANGENPAHRDD